ncbi:perlucin-like protein isoform X2 [Ruditapes philippinarum]|uniref:perlucin-like protein isoform X2 n=1 Tax=Ruditapes philippinarum TaxID=129788 RepID=UPI00295A8C6E|nr:perlucin-like protein isoform X2 [Ruditapes philippinarum]
MSECPSGWREHGQSCYFFSHDEEYWTGAFEMCRIIGGQLVEIEDEFENSYITSVIASTGREYWISLSDIVEENRWVWMTSMTPITYTNWDNNEPTSVFHGHLENCVDMHTNGKWNDVTCTTRKFYVCEKQNVGIDVIG